MTSTNTTSKVFTVYFAKLSKVKDGVHHWKRPCKSLASLIAKKARGIFLDVKNSSKWSCKERVQIDKDSGLHVSYDVDADGHIVFAVADRTTRAFHLRFNTRKEREAQSPRIFQLRFIVQEERDEFIKYYTAARLLSLNDVDLDAHEDAPRLSSPADPHANDIVIESAQQVSCPFAAQRHETPALVGFDPCTLIPFEMFKALARASRAAEPGTVPQRIAPKQKRRVPAFKLLSVPNNLLGPTSTISQGGLVELEVKIQDVSQETGLDEP